jgi:pimeloyl-ACP methyl ester carboxylesterase
MRDLIFLFLLAAAGMAGAQASAVPPHDGCGDVAAIPSHGGTTMRYALWPALSEPPHGARVALVMLVGGGGYLNLDDTGCPQLLKHNSLIRMGPLLREAGLATVLVDAPSDLFSEDGLGGFRIASAHADDLGKVIAEVRARTGGAVWIVGHSRGTISAASAAARLAGPSAPDGVVLMSAMMVGAQKGKKSWVRQTVFSVDLESIKVPVLVIGHAADSCERSPAGLMGSISENTRSGRQQVVTVTGGPVAPGRLPGLAACEVGEPHDFVDQEAEVAAGIMRFIRGSSY